MAALTDETRQTLAEIDRRSREHVETFNQQIEISAKAWNNAAVYVFFQAEDGIRADLVTGVQTCALPISHGGRRPEARQQCDTCSLVGRPSHRVGMVNQQAGLVTRHSFVRRIYVVRECAAAEARVVICARTRVIANYYLRGHSLLALQKI